MSSIPLPALATRVTPPSDPVENISKLVALKSMLNQQRIQENQMNLQGAQLEGEKIRNKEAELASQDNAKATQAWNESNGDPDAYESRLRKLGVSAKYQVSQLEGLTKLREGIATLDDKHIDILNKRNEYIGQRAQQVLNAPPEQKEAAWQAAAADLLKNGMSKPGELPMQYPGDEFVNTKMMSMKAVDEMLNRHKTTLALEKDAAETYQKWYEMSGQTLQKVTNQGDWKKGIDALKSMGAPTSVLAQINPTFSPEEAKRVASLAISPEKYLTMPLDKLEFNAYMLKHPDSDADEYGRIMKTLGIETAANLQKNLLTPEAVDVGAIMFHTTGSVPQGMYRSKEMVATIINRSAQMFPGENIGSNKAIFEANKAALVDITKKSSALDAFENTAIKNIEVLKKRLEDLQNFDTKLFNTPYNAWRRDILGDKAKLAYDTAHSAATTEAARIINSPNLTGVLSDEARKGGHALIDKNASPATQLEQINVVYNDFTNRKSSYDLQKRTLEERIKGASTTEPKSAEPPKSGPKKLSDYPEYQPPS